MHTIVRLQIYFDPKTDDFLTTPFVEFGNLAPDGTVGAIGLGLEAGNRTVSLCGGRSTKERKPHADPRFLPEFGSPFKLEAVGYSSPAVILGFTGLADDAHIVQVGAIIEARTLSLAQSPSPQLRQRLSWPKVRDFARARSIANFNLHEFCSFELNSQVLSVRPCDGYASSYRIHG